MYRLNNSLSPCLVSHQPPQKLQLDKFIHGWHTASQHTIPFNLKTQKQNESKLIPIAIETLIRIFIISLAISLSTSGVKAQTVSDAYVTLETSPTDSTLAGTYIVMLTDTNSISSVLVILGSDSGLTDIMTHTFLFDVQSGLPAGFSYSRTGYKITLAIGTYSDQSTFFGEARLQISNGTWTSPYQFITN